MRPTTAGLQHHDEAERRACSIMMAGMQNRYGARRRLCSIRTTAGRTATALDGKHAEPLRRSTAGMQHYDGGKQHRRSATGLQLGEAEPTAPAVQVCSSGGTYLQLRWDSFAAPAGHICSSGGTYLQLRRDSIAAPAPGLLCSSDRTHLQLRAGLLCSSDGGDSFAAPAGHIYSSGGTPVQLRRDSFSASTPHSREVCTIGYGRLQLRRPP
jgi:hypothetical protein